MDKTIIDKDGNVIIDHVIVVNNKFINYNYELKEAEQLIDYDKRVNELIKPRWNGTEWTEGATEEEIQAKQEENKVEVNTEENLIDKLILDNINMQTQIDNLIQANLGGN